MTKRKGKKISELKVPKWILGAVIVSLMYAVIFFIAYDMGKRTTQLKYLGVKAKEIKRATQKPIEVPPFVPPQKGTSPSKVSFHL